MIKRMVLEVTREHNIDRFDFWIFIIVCAFALITIFLSFTVKGDLPDTLTHEVGTVDSGNINSFLYDDNDYYNISEVAGTPAISYNLTIENTDLDTGNVWLFLLKGFYDGNSGHDLTLQIYNNTSLNFDNIMDIPDSTSEIVLYENKTSKSEWIDGDGDILLRLYHSSAGNINHNFGVNYLEIIKINHGLNTTFNQQCDLQLNIVSTLGNNYNVNNYSLEVNTTLTVASGSDFNVNDTGQINIGGTASVDGNLIINNTLTHDFNVIDVNAGGKFYASKGNTDINVDSSFGFYNDGEWYHSDGTVRFLGSGGNKRINGNFYNYPFYNLYNANEILLIYNSDLVSNRMRVIERIYGTSAFRPHAISADLTLWGGNNTNDLKIDNSRFYGGGAQGIYLRAWNSTLPIECYTGNLWLIHRENAYSPDDGFYIRDCIFYNDFSTGASGVVVKMESDILFTDNVTTVSGSTFDMQGYILNCTYEVTLNSGTIFTENGEIEANIFDSNIDLTIGSGEQLHFTNTTTVQLLDLIINSGGKCYASKYEMTVNDAFTNAGTYIHNKGEIIYDGNANDEWDTQGTIFYDMNMQNTAYMRFTSGFTCINYFGCNGTTWITFYDGGTGGRVAYFGNSTQYGYIVGNQRMRFTRDWYFYGGSINYGVIVTNTVNPLFMDYANDHIIRYFNFTTVQDHDTAGSTQVTYDVRGWLNFTDLIIDSAGGFESSGYTFNFDSIFIESGASFEADGTFIGKELVDNNSVVITGDMVLTQLSYYNVTGSMTQNIGTVFYAPENYYQIGTYDNNAGSIGYVHNNGNAIITAGSSFLPNNSIFYNLTLSGTTDAKESFNVINNLLITSMLRSWSITITIGNNTQSGTIAGQEIANYPAFGTVKLYAYSEDYYYTSTNIFYFSHYPGTYYFKWGNMLKASYITDDGPGSEDNSISCQGNMNWTKLYLQNDKFYTNGYNMTFTRLDINSDGYFYGDNSNYIINDLETYESNATKTHLDNTNITLNGYWDLNINLAPINMNNLIVNGEIEFNNYSLQKNSSFDLTIESFINNTGEFNITANVNYPFKLHGAENNTLIDFNNMTDYYLINVEVDNLTNIDIEYITIHGNDLGNLSGLWDFTPPIILYLNLTNGIDLHKQGSNLFNFSFYCEELSYIHSYNWTITHKATDILFASGQVNLSSATNNSYQIQFYNITFWYIGDYWFNITCYDTHNLLDEKAINKELVQLMKITDGKNKTGKYDKHINKLIGKELRMYNYITNSTIYTLEFINTKNESHTIYWYDDTDNFKMRYDVELKDSYVEMYIKADRLIYMPETYNFVINEMYFYDISDFIKSNSTNYVWVSNLMKDKDYDYYIVEFHNENWIKESLISIDPLSGMVNNALETLNFSVSGTVPAYGNLSVDNSTTYYEDYGNTFYMTLSYNLTNITKFILTSSIDGEFYNSSTNTTFNTNLSIGSHNIQLKVMDELYGFNILDNLTIYVLAEPIANIININALGQTVVFNGGYTQIENNTIVRYVWRSNQYPTGPFYNGTSNPITAHNFSTGNHTIYFKILDSNNRYSEEVSENITVLDIVIETEDTETTEWYKDSTTFLNVYGFMLVITFACVMMFVLIRKYL